LTKAMNENYDLKKNAERESGNYIQENKDFIATLLQCEDIEIRNYMTNIYNKFKKVYTDNIELEAVDVDIKSPTKMDLLQHPKLLLLFWYKILYIECNHMNNPNAKDNICVDVNEIVSTTSLSDTTTSTLTNATSNISLQDGKVINYVDTLSFRTLYNNMAVKINISIVNRNIENIHFNSDPFLPNLNSQISDIILKQVAENNADSEIYKRGGKLDIIKLVKTNIWSLIGIRLSLRHNTSIINKIK